MNYFLCYEIFFERSGGVLVPGSEHRLFSGGAARQWMCQQSSSDPSFVYRWSSAVLARQIRAGAGYQLSKYKLRWHTLGEALGGAAVCEMLVWGSTS